MLEDDQFLHPSRPLTTRYLVKFSQPEEGAGCAGGYSFYDQA